VTPIEPVGPVEVRPRPVERALAVERSRRAGKREPERDPKERKPRPQAENGPQDGHLDVRV
jgi:hypothetical protein